MHPRVIFVVAHDRRGVMGRNGELPWHLPEDLKHFRRLTIGKPVIMGRKTYAGIGKPLVRRQNIVLTRDPLFQSPGVDVAHSVQEALALAAPAPEVAVIGGAEIFTAFSDLVDTAYVTRIEADVEGDVHYAPPARTHREEIDSRYAADDRNAYDMTFLRVDYSQRPSVTGGSLNESKPSL